MYHQAESRRVFDWLVARAADNCPAALATVIRVEGSAYRRPGAKMAIADDGDSVGNISGGCLEGDVREVAREVIVSGRPQRRVYRSRSDEIRAWDLGLGCDGEVEVYIEPGYALTEDEDVFVANAGLYCVVCTLVDVDTPSPERLLNFNGDVSGSLGDDAFNCAVLAEVESVVASRQNPGLHRIADRDVFLDVYWPRPQLLIFGAGDDAAALAHLARSIGFVVNVIDRRPALLDRARFPAGTELGQYAPGEIGFQEYPDRNEPPPWLDLTPHTSAVLMTHNFADDRGYLRDLAWTPIPYIGILGPHQRTQRIIDAVMTERPFHLHRLFAPVGLDLGAEGHAQVAVAIVAELMAIQAGRPPVSLRTRTTPIHASDAPAELPLST
jgi:xanthine dehydrogenase accessory factor